MSNVLTAHSLPLRRPRSRSLLGAILDLPRLWFYRQRCRRELAHLDADQMRDTGLNPRLVMQEAAKPFWRA